MNHIGIYTIATNKYLRFIPELSTSIQEKFLPGFSKKLVVLTNQQPTFEGPVYHDIESFGFPLDSLFRFRWYSKISEVYFSDCDYIFFIDADMRIAEILTVKELDLQADYLCVRHPGFYKGGGTFEDRVSSTAFVPLEKRSNYKQACFFGAKKTSFDKMATQLDANITKDFKNNLIAIWHDESHLNAYLSDKSYTLLDPGYAYPEKWDIPFAPKIIHLAKNQEAIRLP